MSEPLQISVHVDEKRYQPTQEKTVVPDWNAKTVTPDRGYALSKVTVEGMPEPTESETFTENGTYDVGRIGTAIVNVDVDLQNKTVTPTEQTQTIEADSGYDGLDTVTVNPIPSEYVVPTGSIDITANGTVSVSGKATARVNVPIPPGYVIPSGSVDITANGQGIDVAGKSTVNVNVPQGVFPSGTKVITENVTGEDVTNYAAVDVAVPGPSGTKQISITQNGTMTENVADYADAEITVDTDPEKGLVFGDYDSNGYPHSARFVGTWTEVPDNFFRESYYYLSKVYQIILPETVRSVGKQAFCQSSNISDFGSLAYLESIGQSSFQACSFTNILLKDNVLLGNGANIGGCFYGCINLKTVTFLGNVSAICLQCFDRCTSIELYDFSNCGQIPTLASANNTLGHKNGCVIRIPAALSDTTLGEGNGWESATNWVALTNIVWEVV